MVVVEDEETIEGHGRSTGANATELVANRPIVDHVIDELRAAGIDNVAIVCSLQRAAEIRAALASGGAPERCSVRFVEGSGPLGFTDALKLAAPVVGQSPCIVHLASGLLAEPLSLLLSSLRDDSPNVVLTVHQQPGPGERLSDATQQMLHVAELHPEEWALGMAGVWLFGPGTLDHVAQASWRSNGAVDLTDVAERIAAAGASLHVRLTHSWSNYGGNPLELLELNQIALDRLPIDPRRSNANGNGYAGNRIEGRVLIHPTASVRSSVIVGPTVIGPDARVSDAYVGPYTSIGPDARIEGAEVERSIIAAGASIMHIGGRLVASIVGRDARIFRDFSLPRALRLRVGDGTEVSLC